jgi:hypothetical protein
MSEADYYPPGAYNDPNAPWNEVGPEPRDMTVDVIIELRKRVEVEVCDYKLEIDDDGCYASDFDDCDFEAAYKEGHKTPKTMFDDIVKLYEEVKENGWSDKCLTKLELIADDARDWEQEIIEVDLA